MSYMQKQWLQLICTMNPKPSLISYQLSSPCLTHLSHSISEQITMYHHHHHHHHHHQHNHLHHHGHRYHIQRAIQDERNFCPKSTFELTFVFFAMLIFQKVVMFYANRLISAWNNHHRDHTHELRKTAGLDSSVIASLPVFTHGVIGDRELGVMIECVVCFSTVEEGELVKVLPNCRHSFHVACIDMWLRLHSACPLCRGSVEPKEKRTKM